MSSRIHLNERSLNGIWRRAGLVMAGGFVAVAVSGCTAVNAPAPTATPQQVAQPVPAAIKPADATLKISSPTAGEIIHAGQLKVSINYSGPTLVPGAEAKKLDDYHLHYFLDEDASQYISAPKPIPTGNAHIIHSAAKEVTFDSVGAGTHTVAVVMSGNNHIPTSPPLSDTATFSVQ